MDGGAYAGRILIINNTCVEQGPSVVLSSMITGARPTTGRPTWHENYYNNVYVLVQECFTGGHVSDGGGCCGNMEHGEGRVH